MARSKRERRKSEMIIYSFGVDDNDPKYRDLIDFLESIDVGFRSHMVRQILNSYVKSQSDIQTVPLIPVFQPSADNKQEKEETKNVATDSENKVVAHTVVETPPSVGTPVEVVSSEQVVEKTAPKKVKSNPKLAALKNTFN